MKEPSYKSLSNFMIGPMREYCNKWGIGFDRFPIDPAYIVELLTMVENGLISKDTAEKVVFPKMVKNIVIGSTQTKYKWWISNKGEIFDYFEYANIEVAKHGKLPLPLGGYPYTVYEVEIPFEYTKVENPLSIVYRMDLWLKKDDDALDKLCREVVDKLPQKADEYRKGKTGLLGMFIGEFKKLSKDNYDLAEVSLKLKDLLNENVKA